MRGSRTIEAITTTKWPFLVLLDGAKERAQDNGDIETLCLLLSIGTDVTANYVNIAPNNQQINQRLVAMNQDLNMCFNMLEKTALKS